MYLCISEVLQTQRERERERERERPSKKTNSLKSVKETTFLKLN